MEKGQAQPSHPNASWRIQPPLRTDSKAADRQRESPGDSGDTKLVCKEDQNQKCLLHFRTLLAETASLPSADVACELLMVSSNRLDQIDGRINN